MRLPKPRKKKHLPSLTPASLDVFLQSLDTLPISPAAKTAVQQSMTVATNPAAESPDAVIESMDPADRAGIRQAQRGYAALFAGVAARGRAALLSMTDFEERINDSE